MIQWKERSLLKLSTSTYKHKFKSSQLVPPYYLFSTCVFSASVWVVYVSVHEEYHCPTNSNSLHPSLPTWNLLNPIQYIYRFAATCVNYIMKHFERPPFMLPSTNFATLNVHTKKASLDALCVSSSQSILKLKWKVVTPCTIFAEVTEDMKQPILQTQILLQHSSLHAHAIQHSPPPKVAITSTFSFSYSSGPSAWAMKLHLNWSRAYAARSLVFNLPVDHRSEIQSVPETFFLSFFHFFSFLS